LTAVSRQEILEAIRQLTVENGGRAPGKGAFVSRTGIRESDWYGRYWARWGDALDEAGVSRNAFTAKLSETDLLDQLSEVIRHLGRFPTYGELRMFGRENPGFPSHTTWTSHFKGRDLKQVYAEWAGKQGRPLGFDYSPRESAKPLTSPVSNQREGWVYLLKSGDHYKIGRSDTVERRVKEISIALPQSVEMVHAIKTDDPAGIENYWHRRFSNKRANGEWFALDAADVRAFKRRTFQ
jgi:hypothetical protein